MPVRKATLIAAVAFAAPHATAADYLVLQREKAFVVSRLMVKVGDTVRFLNLDPVPHNAFSVSRSNPFDTGMFTKGGSKDISFANPGVVEVECAVHPGMKMVIDVQH